jgi:NADH-quinone oxidoreductase subunit L
MGHEQKALLGIVLLPLFGAIINGLFGRGKGKDWQVERGTVHGVACMSVAGSFVLALFCFYRLWAMKQSGVEDPELSITAYEWFSISLAGKVVPVQVRFAMDALSAVMTLVVTGIGLLIHIYSTGYMSEEKSFARFFSYLNLFTASMLILVLGSNLPLMFVGWEGVGLCSYLLIGFWWENPAYAAAGRKAFVANRIGDFGVLIGMFLLVGATGSFEFSEINAAASSLTQAISLPGVVIPTVSVATAATLFLFLGCTGKSAQIPLFVWLPDAMAGPTPVSALIHAATMVTSGLYLICRLSPVFALAPLTMAVIAVIGVATALLAATIGCVQNDIKKVLAYSTVSQLGFMFAGAGCGAFAASFFHVYTHAFFKACLFLGAGSVMHAVGAHGDADIRRLGGLRRYLPWTHATFAVSCAAIAGVPFFSGFFSKDELLVGALSVGDYLPADLGKLVFAGLVLAATMTAFYMFRLYFMTFAGEYRGGPEHEPAPAAHGDHAHGDDHAAAGHDAHDDHAHHEPHESPASITIPLAILAFGAFAAGYVWVGLAHFEPWVKWLEPALGKLPGEHPHQGAMVAVIAGTTAAAIGILLAYFWYGRPGVEAPARLAAALPGVHRFLMDKWRVDELYDATILALSRLFGTLSGKFDQLIVDGVLAKLSTALVQLLGTLATRLQNGLIQSYAAVMVAGVLGVTWWFAVPHPRPEITSRSGDEVQLSGAPGLGYSYRWDFEGNGTWDTDWSNDASTTYTFGESSLRKGFVAVLEPAVYAASLRERRLLVGERWQLDGSDLGPAWLKDPEKGGGAPVVEVTEAGLVVHPKGARARLNGNTVDEAKIVLKRGEHVDLGRARLTASGLARPVLYVRNAFGVMRRRSVKLLVPEVIERPAVEVLKVAEAQP